jgi:hypothetical protein
MASSLSSTARPQLENVAAMSLIFPEIVEKTMRPSVINGLSRIRTIAHRTQFVYRLRLRCDLLVEAQSQTLPPRSGRMEGRRSRILPPCKTNYPSIRSDAVPSSSAVLTFCRGWRSPALPPRAAATAPRIIAKAAAPVPTAPPLAAFCPVSRA